MARVGHGETTESQTGAATFAEVFLANIKVAGGEKQPDFGYMFSADPHQRPADVNRLPETAQILAQLDSLGEAMGRELAPEPDPMTDRVQPGDGTVPAGYTYFGQFVDHDITKTAGGDIFGNSLVPLLTLAEIDNERTPLLELDSVYGPGGGGDGPVPAPVGKKMDVGPVHPVGGDPNQLAVPGKSLFNDLPRKGRSTNSAIDREARIGDPRNDENLIVAQMHTAFLKAHNTLADQSASFAAAREKLILMYQSVIMDDFLPRICDAATLNAIMTNGPRFFTTASPLFMPVEFAAAGFRFGHSMVRSRYDFNLNFAPFPSEFMFTFTALSGNLHFQGVVAGEAPDQVGFDHFPDNWIIQWERFLELGGAQPQRARKIDPQLTPILAQLRDTFGNPMQDIANIAPQLARRNLRRGFWFGLPTGQAVATKIGVPAITIDGASTGLPNAAVAPFSDRTPLWLYILAEAVRKNGKLGVVGTTILAETFHTLISRSKPSIFDSHGRRTSSARHKLSDIIQLAAMQD